jgi:hypothetical protein
MLWSIANPVFENRCSGHGKRRPSYADRWEEPRETLLPQDGQIGYPTKELGT